MVTSQRKHRSFTIVARPNRSASWRVNKLVLLALSVPSLGIAAGFALIGAWPILPLAGLELAALGSALYLVNWKLEYRHVITISEREVRIDKGYYLPRQSWLFKRQTTNIGVLRESHPSEGPGICLQNRGEAVCVGDFLNREDCLTLLQLLRQELRVKGDSKEMVVCY
ncbi:DUF2244 domain-containing protein [Parahaliea maris]|uniref:DUF2244 domain-containing protein n=1 Tax=Parahaliea maris TaxID=2716870 RepID=A0A5C9A5Q2_9GAMM|nr:DUF2244 domain-containing protein [Parahaliea maris]TXS96253.1 DUF2244 domain-containing protein [Parahaliea maris]